MFIPVDADLDIWSIWAFSIEWFSNLDVIDHGFVRVQAGQIRNLTLVSINFVGHRCSCTRVFFFEFTEPWNKSFAMTQGLCFATTWKWPAGIFKSKKKCCIPNSSWTALLTKHLLDMYIFSPILNNSYVDYLKLKLQSCVWHCA